MPHTGVFLAHQSVIASLNFALFESLKVITDSRAGLSCVRHSAAA
jgi:hypothetical protein